MTLNIKLKRSGAKDSAPTAGQLEDGELGLNYNKDSLALYCKDTDGAIRQIAGQGSEGLYWDLNGSTLSPDSNTYNVEIGGGNIQLNSNGSAKGKSLELNGLTGSPALKLATGDSTSPSILLGTPSRGLTVTTFEVNGTTNSGVDFNAHQVNKGTLTFSTKSVQRMWVNSDGNVLIGGTLPSAPNIQLNSNGSATFGGNVDILENTRVRGRLNVGSNNAGGMGDGVIIAGDQSASNGQVMLAGRYTNADSVPLIGSMYGSGNALIGYGVRCSTTTSNTFLSTAGNANWKRAALEVGGDLKYSNAAGQTTAVGSEVTMTERFRVDQNGDVQIGGTIPSSPNIELNGSNGSADFTGTVTINEGPQSGQQGGEIVLGKVAGEALVTISSTRVDGSYKGNLEFKTHRNNSNSLTTALTLTNTQGALFPGTVHIGGTLPSAPNIQLKADGSAKFSGTVDIAGAESSGFTVGCLLGENQIAAYTDKTDASRKIYVYNGDTKTFPVSLNCDGSAAFAGQVESQSGGYKFPDGTVQTSAATGGGGGGNTLQEVTDAGNFTTEDILIGGVEASPNIRLNEDGSAEFAGDVVSGDDPSQSENNEGVVLRSRGTVSVNRPSGAIYQGYLTGDSSPTYVVNADGSANFKGQVIQDNSGSTTDGGFWARKTSATANVLRATTPNGVEVVEIKGDGSAKLNSPTDFRSDATGVLEVRTSNNESVAGTDNVNLLRLVANTNKGYTAALFALGKYQDSSSGRGEVTLKVANTSLSSSLAEFKFRGDGQALLPGTVSIGGTLPSSPNITLSSNGSAQFTDRVDSIIDLAGTYNPTNSNINETNFYVKNLDNSTNSRAAVGFSIGESGTAQGAINLVSESGGTGAAFAFQLRKGDSKTAENLRINSDGSVEVAGQIETKSGGIKFPDGSVQVTAATGGGGGGVVGQDIYGLAKVYGYGNSAGQLGDVYGCTMVKRPGETGTWDITFDEPFEDAAYAVTTHYATAIDVKKPNELTLVTYTVDGFAYDGAVSFAIYDTKPTVITSGTGTATTTNIFGAAKAWGDVAVDGTTSDSYNVEVTKTGLGTYQITFDSPLSSANYSVTGATTDIYKGTIFSSSSHAADGFTVICYDSGNRVDIDAAFNFTVHDNTPAEVSLTTTGDVINYSGTAAWAVVNTEGQPTASGTVYNLDASSNIAEVKKGSAAGTYEVTFTTPMPANRYSVVATGSAVNGSSMVVNTADETATGFIIKSYGNSGLANVNNFSFQVQALNALPPKSGTGADHWCTSAGDGFNVESITQSGGSNANNFVVKFTTPMPSTKYAVLATVTTTADGFCFIRDKTVNGYTVVTRDAQGAGKALSWSAAVHATNASLPGTFTKAEIQSVVDLAQTMDVKDTLLKITAALTGLKTAAESASTCDELKAAINTALADI